jgi:lysophospholipase L1-like esterase/Flp pilus assembly pilin Flp
MCPIREAGRRERGATTTEYSLLLAAIAVAAVAALALLGPALVRAADVVACRLGAGCPATGRSPTRVDPWDSPDPVVRATWGAVAVLGDSFSSGEGVGDYGAGGSSPDCHASERGYGVRLARALDVARSRVVVRACTGATTAGIGGRYDDHDQPPQLEGIGPDTSLVALSIGGNDVGWGKALAACLGDTVVVGGQLCVEGTPFTRSLHRAVDAVGPRLDRTLREVSARAPLARVVVLGYPRFFPDQPSDPFRLAGLTLLEPASQAWMNAETDHLNRVVAAAAADAGVEYVDVGRAFAGHELTTATPWINGVDLRTEQRDVLPGLPVLRAPVPVVDASSFHPTAAGQAALSRLVESQVRHPTERSR